MMEITSTGLAGPFGAALGVAGLALAWYQARRAAAAQRELVQAQHDATHDPLTQLLNRAGLHQAWARLQSGPRTVVTLDLNDFKPINDRHGHEAGDLVLTTISARLRATWPGIIARLGGDEFVLILAGEGRQHLDRVEAAVSQPIRLAGAEVAVSASFGVVVCTSGNLRAALADADAAMYRAKRTTRSIAEFALRRDDHGTTASSPRPPVRTRDRYTTAAAVVAPRMV